MWIDRVACAWLIQRFIDKQATFIWLDKPEECPQDALGFDFNGAQFTHAGDKVSFEVLMFNFHLENIPGLKQIADIIHFLDFGGIPVPQAKGLETILLGAREQ
ncbi:MAG: chromate resistance protein [Gammaproteobacteria bacterium]|nr:chromate resistance protein [Gammaproteobacteria bacterium]